MTRNKKDNENLNLLINENLNTLIKETINTDLA